MIPADGAADNSFDSAPDTTPEPAEPSFPSWVSPEVPAESCSQPVPGTTPDASNTDPPSPESVAPNPGSGAAGEAGASLQDHLVHERLLLLTPGLPADVLDQWIYDDYLGFLADIEHLTESALVRYLDWLIEQLRQCGYPPRQFRHYRRVWREIATERARTRRAAKQATHAENEATGELPPRFVVRERVAPIGGRGEEPTEPNSTDLVDAEKTEALFDNAAGRFMTNFTMFVDEELMGHDSQDRPPTQFGCRLKIYDRETRLRISARDYSDNHALAAAIQEAGGSRVVIHSSMDNLREAISTLSWTPQHRPRRRGITTDFGWTPDGTAYLFPGGAVMTDGFIATMGPNGLEVDLSGEEQARHLGLLPPGTPDEGLAIKRHVAEELLQLHVRRVTFSLLGATAAAILTRFVPEANPFALWLVGLTGAGKSFLARLFMSFFGDFPVASGRFAGWSSTANFLQRQGFYFKDALYLIDDYKPDITRQSDVVRTLQNYADRAGRGRLKVDATTNVTRPIRGLLASTGEDVPEHTPSAMARSIIIPVPQQEKSLLLGQRCQEWSSRYRSMTADFVHYVLAQHRQNHFIYHYRRRKSHIQSCIDGQLNDSRIANNFALLAAGLCVMADYLSDVWPDGQRVINRFIDDDLYELREAMLWTVVEQQPSVVFWTTLCTLLQHGIVTVDARSSERAGVRLIGKAKPASDLVYISTELALEAVNTSLRNQGRGNLPMTISALLGQLRSEGRLLDSSGEPLPAHGAPLPPCQPRIEGIARRCFTTSRALLGLGGAGGYGTMNTSPQEAG